MSEQSSHPPRSTARLHGPGPSPTRRVVLAGLGALALVPPLPPAGRCAIVRPPRSFPPGFVWGVAASAPQTESAQGRGESIWDAFAAKPGAIRDGSTMHVATAFDAKYLTDIGMVADAGIKAFRFSFAWPRVQPTGKGAPNEAGLALYDRILDAMLAHGIEPWATTFHWDIPVALGDWRNRDLAYRYADYAALLARRFGDRIRHWIALNEPNVVAFFGYGYGGHAPDLRSKEAWLAAVHHQNLAQGLGIRALRRNLPADRRVGTTVCVEPVRPADGADPEAAALADAAWNGAFLKPLYGQPYPAQFQRAIEPLIRPGDMTTIAAAPDFLGVNYYARLYVAASGDSPLGFNLEPAPANLDRTAFGWPIEPDGLEEMLMMVKDTCGNPPVAITEFGAAFADPPAIGATVDDPRRIDFIRRYLTAMADGIDKGADLEGAFYWSATDNWEWGQGFTMRFGLIGIDPATLARTPKKSLAYYGRCAMENAVM